MPVRPTFLENLLFFRLNQAPVPLFELFGAGAFRVVAIGVKLGLFEAVGIDNLSCEEIASRIGYDKRATAILLEFLSSLGYLKRRGTQYENTSLRKNGLFEVPRFLLPT